MTKVKIMLDSIAAVKKFVSVVSMYDFDVDLASGRYAVDAKSIMGIFSLDLSNPIQLVAHTDDATKFLDEIKNFDITKALSFKSSVLFLLQNLNDFVFLQNIII